jgi:hypothetical protein
MKYRRIYLLSLTLAVSVLIFIVPKCNAFLYGANTALAVSKASQLCDDYALAGVCPAIDERPLDPWGNPYACFVDDAGRLTVGSHGKREVGFAAVCVVEERGAGNWACLCDMFQDRAK